MEESVLINIEGEPGAMMSYQFRGTRGQLIEILYSAMREDQDIYFLIAEACHRYEEHLTSN
jgi:hypothetical protein